MSDQLPEVGASDAERRTLPIYDEDEERSLDMEQETTVCYFNDVVYPVGQYVRSGSELLRCEEGGVWVRRGDMRPK